MYFKAYLKINDFGYRRRNILNAEDLKCGMIFRLFLYKVLLVIILKVNKITNKFVFNPLVMENVLTCPICHAKDWIEIKDYHYYNTPGRHPSQDSSGKMSQYYAKRRNILFSVLVPWSNKCHLNFGLLWESRICMLFTAPKRRRFKK